jgi:thiamine transport system substrate-binding protein
LGGQASPKKPVLKVAVYRSFVGPYGPGNSVKEGFEKRCACRVEWALSDDAGSLFGDLRSKRHKNVDVALGFDQSLVAMFKGSKLLEPRGPAQKQPPTADNKAQPDWMPQAGQYGFDFQPLDFGFYSVIVDSNKTKTAPASLREFLSDPNFSKSLAAQDPRTSTPGLGLLIWLRTIARDDQDFDTLLGQLGRQALTFSKGWSEAYGLFTKGETKSVLSYITSELYHVIEEKTERYKALAFTEGHPDQVEYVAVVRGSSQKQLAESFMNFLLETEVQKSIAMRNWMFPVTREAMDAMPPQFRQQLARFQPLKVSSELYSPPKRRELIGRWSRVLAQSRKP